MTENIPHETTSSTRELPPEKVVRDVGGRMLILAGFRVAYHEGRADMTSNPDGTQSYTVANSQYPDQGDFLFAHDPTADGSEGGLRNGASSFDTAVVRAYGKGGFQNTIHAVFAPEDGVVRTEDEGVVYIKNGTEVVTHQVPADIVLGHVDGAGGNAHGGYSDDAVAKLLHDHRNNVS